MGWENSTFQPRMYHDGAVSERDNGKKGEYEDVHCVGCIRFCWES